LHCEVASGVIEAGLHVTVIDAPDGTAGDCLFLVPPPQAVSQIETKQHRNTMGIQKFNRSLFIEHRRPLVVERVFFNVVFRPI
jgi:hypothetical protein